MVVFEWILLLLFVAVVLTGVARRIRVPFPALLAIGGALLALVPFAPELALDPELALALFVAPVLLDAGFDTSIRDLRQSWRAVTGLVVVAVGVTTAAVAVVAHALVPELPWGAAIALGAIVAPPDAVAATAVLRDVRPPHRLLVILEGESLLNDASALLLYRFAVGATMAGGLAGARVVPTMLVTIVGSLVLGWALAKAYQRFTAGVHDIPSFVVLTFAGTFGVWILAEHLHLSAVLTIVTYAITVARTAPGTVSARLRVPTYAVWDTVIFVLNVLAFVLVGLQLRPILERLSSGERASYLTVAAAVLATVIVVRLAWVMSYTAVARWAAQRRAATAAREAAAREAVAGESGRAQELPSLEGGLVVAWSGMRGIVTLATALALPAGGEGAAFPFRDLLVLTAFCVVLGTLVIHGLTLRPLVKHLALRDDGPVEHEVSAARAEAMRAAVASLDAETDPGLAAEVAAIRREYAQALARAEAGPEAPEGPMFAGDGPRRRAVQAARAAVLALRDDRTIGDTAFHQVEEELDWLEMGVGGREG